MRRIMSRFEAGRSPIRDLALAQYAIEDVDELVFVFDHEMAGDGHAGKVLKAEAAGEFEEKDGERDGQAFAVVDDVADIAVGAIVIIGAAAVETIVDEEIFDEAIDRAVGDFFGHGFELALIKADVYFRIVVFGEQEGGVEEVDLGFRLFDDFDQFIGDFLAMLPGCEAAETRGFAFEFVGFVGER